MNSVGNVMSAEDEAAYQAHATAPITLEEWRGGALALRLAFRAGLMRGRATRTPADCDRVVADAIRNVCELGGYTSPDDQPDLLQCTVGELEACIRRALGEDV